MTRRRKPGRKPKGLTISKTFMLTPKDERELIKAARDFPSQGDVIRAALDLFFLTRNVRNTDTIVYSAGQPEQQVA